MAASNPAADVDEIVELSAEAPDERRLEAIEQQRDAGHGGEGGAQGRQVPRPGGGERDARHQAFEILDTLEHLARLGALGGLDGERLHRVKAIPDAFENNQRTEQPGSQQPSTHRRDGSINLVQERSGTAALGGLQDLEVLQRGRVDQQRVGRVLDADGAHVRQFRLLCVTEVAHQRAGRGDRRLAAFEPIAIETAHAQLVEQRLSRALQVEVPPVHLGDRQLQAGDLWNGGSDVIPARHHDLARTEHRNLVAERLQAFGPSVLGDVEFAGGEIEQRDAVLDRALMRP